MINPKCNAATWCTALATPNTSYCRLHVKYPLLHSFEAQGEWLTRIRQTPAFTSLPVILLIYYGLFAANLAAFTYHLARLVTAPTWFSPLGVIIAALACRAMLPLVCARLRGE